GGTYAHEEIALDFCYWLSPELKVNFNKEFIRLKEEELGRKGVEWHIKKITDNIEEVRNLLDTIPVQNPLRNRLNYLLEDDNDN
ncbi:MAG: KilA-N domain-containing protein, partial [Bacteroidota bacterium]